MTEKQPDHKVGLFILQKDMNYLTYNIPNKRYSNKQQYTAAVRFVAIF